MTGPNPADGRFAPSPSGALHLGNLRTALLAWCFARSHAGRFLLRIEDLDPQRSRSEHEAGILADLAAVGIDWDGEPSHQSEQLERHRGAFEELRADGRLYRCWCTRAEIREALEAPHGTAGAAYPGTCRGLAADERRRRERGGSPCAWRFDAGAQEVRFADLLAGERSAVVDDFVVWREGPPAPDQRGLPAYNLAVVVDDAADGVGQVVRGDDLLDTTPRQIALARALGLAVPSYAHVPLVLSRDGERLAKRHGAVTLTARLEGGESVGEVVGWLAASAGLAAAGSSLSAADVLAAFDPAKLLADAAVLQPGPLSGARVRA
ncbi:MAG TPA: tRNA glutamyl-Q(34) synthetase GluQRS [Solirubrobacteraceae bacterium]|nr:tRNA glutamyl-Q(34) synthetase GluQRS [Solirubrobacteraceae bacterium]